MDQLAAIRVFIAVAEESGFAPAARRLGASTSAVSRHIAELETHLGAELLRRSTRRVSLTEAGERYLKRASGLIDELSALDSEVADLAAAPRGTLRISASPTFGDFVVSPIAARFVREYPDITLDLEFTDRVVDIVAEGYDAALRAGALRDSALRSRRLATVSHVLCASPEYIARRGAPERPEDLVEHDCIMWRWRSKQLIWRLMDGDRVVEVPVSGRFYAGSDIAEREGARAGVGVALLNRVLAEDDLKSGRLVRVLEDYPEAPWPITAVWPAARAMPLKLRVFIDFLADALHKVDGGAATETDRATYGGVS